MQEISNNVVRRRLLVALGGSGLVAAAVPSTWIKPVVSSVILPAHAQTSSLCVADTTVGGPLAGHPSGASTCQAACEAEAADLGGQLCLATETVDSSSAVQCSCEIDLP